MRILIHQPRASYYVGGGEVVPLAHARFLAKRGHKVTLLTQECKSPSVIFQEFLQDNPAVRVEFIRVPDSAAKKYSKIQPGTDWLRWNAESAAFGLAAVPFYEKSWKKYDVAATHMSTDSLWIPTRLTNVLHLHGVPPEWTDSIRLAVLRPDGFCAHSASIASAWRESLTLKNVRMTRNGIDTRVFTPDPKEERKIDLLFVGRLLPHKGIMEMLNAASAEMNVCVVGSGPLAPTVREFMSKHAHWRLLSNVGTEELASLYRSAKIFCCPSLEREGILTTMLEAAASGCAIITTDACGMVDFAVDQKTAFLVQNSDIKGLRIAIHRLLGDARLLATLQRNAYQAIQRSWSWEKRIIEVEAAYSHFLSKR